MKMTLFADASFHPRTGAGGWGAWAIRDDWNRGQFLGGPIKFKNHKIDNSNTAEMAGIALALWQLDKQQALDGVEQVMIQCDNIAALGFIHKKIPRTKIIAQRGIFIGKTRWQNPVVAVMLDTIKEILDGKQVQVKHVKGHQGGELNGRAWVNTQCDAEARRHMTAMKRELR